jgi:hypothetical protein
MPMLSPPLRRSPFARQVSVTAPPLVVLIFTVTETGFSFAGMGSTTSGSASGKLMVVGAIWSLARAATVALMIKVSVSVAASAMPLAPTRRAVTRSATEKLRFINKPSCSEATVPMSRRDSTEAVSGLLDGILGL